MWDKDRRHPLPNPLNANCIYRCFFYCRISNTANATSFVLIGWSRCWQHWICVTVAFRSIFLFFLDYGRCRVAVSTVASRRQPPVSKRVYHLRMWVVCFSLSAASRSSCTPGRLSVAERRSRRITYSSAFSTSSWRSRPPCWDSARNSFSPCTVSIHRDILQWRIYKGVRVSILPLPPLREIFKTTDLRL